MASRTNKVRRPRTTGAARVEMTDDVVASYARGASIRSLAQRHDRSFGFIRGLLLDAGVQLRGRGGNVRRRSTVEA